MSDASARVLDLVARLVQKLVPSHGVDAASSSSVGNGGEQQKKCNQRQTYLTQYSLKILSSRMYPSVSQDEFYLSQTIQKALGTGGSKNSSNIEVEHSNVVRFQELFSRLQRQSVMKEKFSLLYLLYTLRNRTLPSFLKGGFIEPLRESNSVFNYPFSSIEPTAAPLSSSSSSSSSQSKSTPTPSSFVPREMGKQEVSEEYLLRDLIFTFQGIDGTYIKFSDVQDRFGIPSDVGVSISNRILVGRLTELGWFYRKVCAYINATLDVDYFQIGSVSASAANRSRGNGGNAKGRATPSSNGSGGSGCGLVKQAFCGALQQELTEYYRLIAVLEAQVGRDGALHDSHRHQQAAPEEQLTLKRLCVWVDEPMERLRTLALLVDAAQGLEGGALASAVGSYLRHGDATRQALARRILRQLCRPIMNFVQRWITTGCGDGDLAIQDPFGEFFVAEDPTVPVSRLWHDRYKLRAEMVPSFIHPDLAMQILIIGKSINFIRQACLETQWVTNCKVVVEDILALGDFGHSSNSFHVNSFFFSSASISDASGHGHGSSHYSTSLSSASSSSHALVDHSRRRGVGGQQAGLEAAAREAACVTDSHLMELMLGRYKFRSHCLALKKYLLLGQGDFIQVLLELAHNELNKPARELFRHNLMSLVDAAVRGSNAQYEDSDILNRLSVRLLRAGDGDRGWDVFSLDYVVDNPINVVFTELTMSKYLRVFNFLWRLKRVEYSLNHTWVRHMSHAFKLRRLPQLKLLFRRSNVLRHEMNHFVMNLSSYIMFEVLDTAWTDLEEGIAQAHDLHDLISAHDRYLFQIVNKSFLEGPSSFLLQHLLKLLDVIIQFRYLQDRLYDQALAEVERREELTAQLAKTAEYSSGSSESKEASEKDDLHRRRRTNMGVSSAGWGMQEDASKDDSTFNRHIVMEDLKREVSNHLDKVERTFHALILSFFDVLADLKQSSTGGAIDPRYSSLPYRYTSSEAGGGMNNKENRISTNFSFLRFRLDFNEYYAAERRLNTLGMPSRV